jgi:hypothetical protein
MARPRKEASYNLTPAKDLKALLRAGQRNDVETNALNSLLKDKIADAVANKGLHRKAFSNARALDKLEPEELNAFFRNFDHYCEVFGLRTRADSAPALEMPEPEPAPERDNVSQIGRGRRRELADVG